MALCGKYLSVIRPNSAMKEKTHWSMRLNVSLYYPIDSILSYVEFFAELKAKKMLIIENIESPCVVTGNRYSCIHDNLRRKISQRIKGTVTFPKVEWRQTKNIRGQICGGTMHIYVNTLKGIGT